MTKLLDIVPRLPLSDIAESYKFYCGFPGLSSADADTASNKSFMILKKDDVRLQLVEADSHHPLGTMTVWLAVEDASSGFHRLENQVTVEWGPEDYWYGLREFAVLYPDGHREIFSSPSTSMPDGKAGD